MPDCQTGRKAGKESGGGKRIFEKSFGPKSRRELAIDRTNARSGPVLTILKEARRAQPGVDEAQVFLVVLVNVYRQDSLPPLLVFEREAQVFAHDGRRFHLAEHMRADEKPFSIQGFSERIEECSADCGTTGTG